MPRLKSIDRLPQPGRVKINRAKRKNHLASKVMLKGVEYPMPEITLKWLRDRCDPTFTDTGKRTLSPPADRAIPRTCHYLWRGTIQKNGSPQCRMALAPHTHKTLTVRRLVYANAHPEVALPHDAMVVNRCRILGCVCPDCLEVMNMSELMKLVRPHLPLSHRANLSKARSKNSKISDDDIARIRYGSDSLEDLAEELGVDPSYPAQVRRGVLRRDYYPNPFTQLIRNG